MPAENDVAALRSGQARMGLPSWSCPHLRAQNLTCFSFLLQLSGPIPIRFIRVLVIHNQDLVWLHGIKTSFSQSSVCREVRAGPALDSLEICHLRFGIADENHSVMGVLVQKGLLQPLWNAMDVLGLAGDKESLGSGRLRMAKSRLWAVPLKQGQQLRHSLAVGVVLQGAGLSSGCDGRSSFRLL